MRVFCLIALLALASTAVDALSEPLRYALSQDCLERIEIDGSEASRFWSIAIEATSEESKRISDFTKQHVGSRMLVVNSDGVPLIPEAATIQSPLGDRFRFVVAAEEDAEHVVSLLASGGVCGPGA